MLTLATTALTRWLYKHNTVFASNRSAICNRCFPGPTRVLEGKRHVGMSIAAAVFAGLGDRPTDGPRYSVGNNRRSAQWRSQILSLSTTTTSIHWRRRLDRSDQLLQSAAIFSGKTRRVAVYVETQYNIYNIGSKRAFPTGSTGDTTAYLFTDVEAV